MSRRVLVTGGAGFIGSTLCKHLHAQGCTVLNSDKLTYSGNLSSLREIEKSNRYYFSQVDVCDNAAVSETIRDFQPDHIMHLAAESHVDRSIVGAREFIDTNIVGTFAILEAARAYWLALPGNDGTPSAFFTCPRMRFMAPWVRTGSSPRKPAMIRARLIQHRRRRPITS